MAHLFNGAAVAALSALALAWPAARGGELLAAEAPANGAVDDAAGADSPAEFQPRWELVERILLAAMPRQFEERKNWGDTIEVFDGLHVRAEGLRITTKRRMREVKHGLWKHYVVEIDDSKPLTLELAELRQTDDGRLAFRAIASAPLHGTIHLQQWNYGVRLLSVTAECDAQVRLTLDGTIAVRVEPGLFAPSVLAEPRITAVHLDLDAFRLHRLGDLDGSVARQIGRNFQGLIRRQMQRREPKVMEKINREIDKHRDELRLSADELVRSQWSRIRKRIEQQGQPPR